MSWCYDEIPCECGHVGVEHHYSPSGCGTSHCEWNADDETGLSPCPCREYLPIYDYLDDQGKPHTVGNDLCSCGLAHYG